MAFLSRCILGSRVMATQYGRRAVSTSLPLQEKVVQPDEAEERIRFKDTAVGVQLEEDSSKPLFGPDFLSGPFGTPANPTMVPSFCDSRLVGCTGPAEDEHDVLWHYVSEEKPTVCLECGQFFKMEKVSHTDMFVDPNEHH